MLRLSYIPQAIIISCCGCFHGRTLAVISMSCDNDAVGGFGPLMPGLLKVEYGNADALAKLLEGRICFYTLLVVCGVHWFCVQKKGRSECLHISYTEHGDNVAGFLFEPIQGEAGVRCFILKFLILAHR